MSVAKVITVDELSNIDSFNIESFETGAFFKQKNIKRANTSVKIDGNQSTLVIKTEPLQVKFDCRVSKYNENKFDVAIDMDGDTDFFDAITGQIRRKIIQLTQANCEKLGYDDDEEIIEDFFKMPFNETEKYGRIFNGKIEENKYKGITHNDLVIDKDDKPILNPDYPALLKRGTEVALIIEMPHIDYYQTEFRPAFKIMKIKILKEAPLMERYYVTTENYKSKSIEITAPQTNDNGGKSSRVKYNNGKYMGQLALKFDDMRLAPFPFANKDENTGREYYNISATIDDEDNHKLLKSISSEIVSFLVKNSKDFIGKKKTEKMVKAVYTDLLRYSKDDKELIKKGEDPKYKPRLDVSAPKYDEQFKFKFLDKDGNVMEEEFGDFKAANPDTRYSIKCSCKHLWYGKTISVKFVLDEIQIMSSATSSVKYQFDEDESSGGAVAPSSSDNDNDEEDEDAPPEDSDAENTDEDD